MYDERPFVADAAVQRITAVRRFNGGLAVYAVMASFVAQQTREISVRMALAWRHLLIGLALGLPVAWWLSRGVAALLFQVTPADPSAYLGVAAILAVVSFMAAWIPACRASRIDPIISLRR
ncbi:MAG: hypothetical protein EXQ49_03535 [Acidobacteria bacterium]|nr:hypothetical protein [Acidobacteriota bacterium]